LHDAYGHRQDNTFPEGETVALNDFQIFPSRDDGYVALQGRLGRETVNVRVPSTAIDDVAEATPSNEQRVQFVRHNLSAFGAIAQAKTERGEATPGEWYGRPVLNVRIGSEDLERYERDGGEPLSYAAFDPRRQAAWVGSDGKFAD
jgi:hypothetical protein